MKIQAIVLKEKEHRLPIVLHLKDRYQIGLRARIVSQCQYRQKRPLHNPSRRRCPMLGHLATGRPDMVMDRPDLRHTDLYRQHHHRHRDISRKRGKELHLLHQDLFQHSRMHPRINLSHLRLLVEIFSSSDLLISFGQALQLSYNDRNFLVNA